jgi:hypothetical protein
VLLGLLVGGAAGAESYDLAADWSDAANPNGVWSYQEGANALPHVDDWEAGTGAWSTPQPGFARSQSDTDRIPFWFRSNGAETFGHDFQTGDVVVHTQDEANGIGNGDAVVAWTSPDAGTATVSGGVWMGRDIGRSNHWALSRNGVVLSEGDIASGDAFDRANRFLFESGSGGAAAIQDLPIAVGDVLELRLGRTSQYGDFVGVDLSIETTFVCPPAPSEGCRAPTLSGKASLVLKQGVSDTKDALMWKWGSGAATLPSELGDPLGASDYHLCVYDGSELAQPRLDVAAPAAGTCAGAPCWKSTKFGFRYKDKERTPDGLLAASLKAGDEGRAKFALKGKGADLGLPALPLVPPATAMLVRSDGGPCWSASYGAPIRNDVGLFKARSD